VNAPDPPSEAEPATGTLGPASRRPVHPHPHYRHGARHWLRGHLVLTAILVAILSVTAVVALAWLERPTATASGPSYPNPNPGNIPVLGVHGQLNFTGSSSDYLTLVGGSNLCPQCPMVPTSDLRYTPPVAGFTFFLNVTNIGSVYHTISAFKLVSPTFAGAPVFLIRAVFCCGPTYAETAETVGFTPGQTIGLMVFVQSEMIPSNGVPGYELDFYIFTSD